MDFTLIEINNHKNNISNLSTKLLNAYDINEEISINNEIKKETEILVSLLNIKMKVIMAQNQQQMQLQQNMFNQMQNMQFNSLYNNFQNQFEQSKNYVTLLFILSNYGEQSPPLTIQCTPDEKLSSVFQKYRMKKIDNTSEIFIYESKKLNEALTVAESGLSNASKIFVINDEELG